MLPRPGLSNPTAIESSASAGCSARTRKHRMQEPAAVVGLAPGQTGRQPVTCNDLVRPNAIWQLVDDLDSGHNESPQRWHNRPSLQFYPKHHPPQRPEIVLTTMTGQDQDDEGIGLSRLAALPLVCRDEIGAGKQVDVALRTRPGSARIAPAGASSGNGGSHAINAPCRLTRRAARDARRTCTAPASDSASGTEW
jgi:hypothetical protein